MTPAAPAGAIFVDAGDSRGSVSPYVRGSNHGPWTFLNPAMQPLAVAGRLTYLRFPGGNWGDLNDIETWQLDQFVTLARQLGAEPAVSVRLKGGTPEKAAALVRYANIERGYRIQFWSIGNEPSLYEGYDTQAYNRDWRTIAEAMQAIDPAIVLVGPDTHQFTANLASNPKDAAGRDWLVEFLKANGDLVDVVAVHRYPFPQGRSGPPAKRTELLASSAEWDTIIPALRALAQEAAGRDLPVAVTEVNSHWANMSGGEGTPETLTNAIWWADALGRMIRGGTYIVAQFCLSTYRGSGEYGLLARDDARPIYYVYPLYAQFGEQLVRGETDLPQVSVFAARRNDAALTVILVNRGDAEAVAPLIIAGSSAAGPAATWRLDRDHSAEQVTDTPLDAPLRLPPESVTLLVIQQ